MKSQGALLGGPEGGIRGIPPSSLTYVELLPYINEMMLEKTSAAAHQTELLPLLLAPAPAGPGGGSGGLTRRPGKGFYSTKYYN